MAPSTVANTMGSAAGAVVDEVPPPSLVGEPAEGWWTWPSGTGTSSRRPPPRTKAASVSARIERRRGVIDARLRRRCRGERSGRRRRRAGAPRCAGGGSARRPACTGPRKAEVKAALETGPVARPPRGGPTWHTRRGHTGRVSGSGEVIAEGRDTEIIDYGPGLVLRRPRVPRSMAAEAEIMRWVVAHGYPCPAAVEVVDEGLVIARVDRRVHAGGPHGSPVAGPGPRHPPGRSARLASPAPRSPWPGRAVRTRSGAAARRPAPGQRAAQPRRPGGDRLDERRAGPTRCRRGAVVDVDGRSPGRDVSRSSGCW